MDYPRLNANDVLHRFEQSIQQLINTIASAPRSLQGSLLATARQRLDGAQLDVSPTPSISRKSRALRRKFERGMEIQIREDSGCPVTKEESDASVELWYDTVCDIALGGIRDELELKTLNEAIGYSMERDKFVGTLDDAIDYALCLAYDHMPVNEEAWLIALARFRLRGYGAPAWSRPAPQGLLG